MIRAMIYGLFVDLIDSILFCSTFVHGFIFFVHSNMFLISSDFKICFF